MTRRTSPARSVARAPRKQPAVVSARAARPLLSLVCAWVALSPAAARAACDFGSVDLSWVRLEGAVEHCPTASQVRADIARRLGRDLVTTGGGPSIETVAQGQPGAWSVQIRTTCEGAPPSVRVLTDRTATCAGIADAAVLAIALTIDPEAALSPPAEAPPAPAPVEDTPRPATPPAPPARSPEPPEAPPFPRSTPPAPPPRPGGQPPAGAAVARGLAVHGIFPDVAPGIAVSGEWSVLPHGGSFLPPITLSIGLMWLPEQRGPTQRLGFGLTAGWAGVCVEAIHGPAVVLGVCGRGFLGSIHAVVYGSAGDEAPAFNPLNPGGFPWFGGAVGGRFAVRVVGPLRLETGIDLIVPNRYKWTQEGNTAKPLFSQPPVAGSIFGGVGVTF
ncbi:hypothetical protein SOCE26_027200 [Sorangium cellulosum]|uniref:Secreted protein n=1 Tax=Sorangium cellulosum TaxID=56 RepID=A0A2L0EPW1_SORCE|nr:hypothetical protein [Sorangium cellulosum]AUX41310.1 hypothetical protein SOCE26_027200 [Sorangium cellulosum]